jgi:hypothetical protein
MKIRAMIFALAIAASAAPPSDDLQINSSGNMVLPADYREWVFLSSGLGMTYGPLAANSGEKPRFDNVFASRAAYQSFLKTGKWPDRTVLVLEVRSSESKGSINRAGNFQSDLAGIEAEVKVKGQWTFYSFGRGTEGKAFARTESCYSCHVANGAVDNTFVQFYPALLPVAKARGTYQEK